MKRAKYILFIIGLLITIYSASGHGSMIRGNVSDSLSNEVLVGATVVLNDTQEMMSTDQLGNFKFDNLEAGTYRLKISFIGYKTNELVITIEKNETRSVIIHVAPSSLRLEEITITSSHTAEQTMTTINKIDIGLRPLKYSQDILRMIPGVVTAQHAGGGKAEQIFPRGFDADHGTDIALTVDDMPVNMVSHAHGLVYADLHFLTP